MKLHFRHEGPAPSLAPPLLILHGVFGSADNWLTLGRRLAENYSVFLLNQRNHGESPHSDTFAYPALAADLHEFIEEHALEAPLLVGHSMGGKTVMHFAKTYPAVAKALVVVDIAPRAYRPHHQAVVAGLEALDRALPTLKTRREADTLLAEHLPELGVRQFLLKNLYRTAENRFAWRLNLPGVRDNLANVGAEITFPEPITTPTLFLRGERSDYINGHDEADIQRYFADSRVQTIPQAGHWVHAEQPEAFLQALTAFLSALA